MGMRVIKAASNYPPTAHWHVIGEDSKKTQYVIKWEYGKDVVTLKRLRHYGSGGVNSATGESWGEPSVWETLPAWEIDTLPRLYRENKQAAYEFVEGLVRRYVEEDLGLAWNVG